MTHPIDLELMRTFVAVAEELSFRRGARRLHMAQPPVSVRIRRLEDALGARLLDRSRRHVALTEAGATLLVRARQLLAESERAVDETRRVARGECGTLAIAYTPTAALEVLPRLLETYRARFPAVTLDLREMRSARGIEALREGRVEIAFVCAPVDDATGPIETLTQERLVVALPERHPLARRRRVPLRALDGLAIVQVDPELEPGWARGTMDALQAEGVAPRVVQRTDGKVAQLGLVAAGVGAGLVSESLSRLRPAGVVLRPLDGLALRLRLAMVAAPTPSPRAAAWRELALASRVRSRTASPRQGRRSR